MDAADGETLAAAELTGTNIMAGPVREVVAPLVAEKAAAGALQVDVATVLPLDQATHGLAKIAEGNARQDRREHRRLTNHERHTCSADAASAGYSSARR